MVTPVMNALKVLNRRYQLTATIKQGGLGTIYRGYDSILGKDIAVKEINQELLGDAWYIDQFQNEARHIARLNHQNIVHIFDLVKTQDGQLYIIMEYIDGLDLASLISESHKHGQPIPQDLAVHIISEVCKALDYVHNCTHSASNEPLNLVHKDISPGNIMITKGGMVKLIDFGIAGNHSRTRGDTVTLQGKYQYMSPEHVNPEWTLDKRSDLFSLGLVFYEMLEGKRFFHDVDNETIVRMLQNGKLKRKKFKETPKPLQKIITTTLEKEPEKRYQNANQLYIDLVTYFVINSNLSNIQSGLGNFIAGLGKKAPPAGQTGAARQPIQFDSLIDDLPTEEVAPDRTEKSSDAEEIEPQTAEPEPHNLTLPVVVETVKEPGPDPEEDAELGDEIKTVIDVVRLSARGHTRHLKRAAIFTGLLGVLFFALDITFRWTGMGQSVYDFMFPPTIRITSKPEGAQVFINDRLQAGVTPISIDDIQPGVHELKLTLDNYDPIVKSIYVPSNGKVEIKGEETRRGNQPYEFPFKAMLEFTSTPEGAAVYLNGIKYGQKTPCSVTWVVGEDCEVVMKKDGFQELAGFVLDSESMAEQIEDRRLWTFEVMESPSVTYRIGGNFGKKVTFRSQPSNADIFVDGSEQPVAKTGEQHAIFLTAASHKVVLRKDGYIARELQLDINEATPDVLSTTLSRRVKFVAYDATNGKSRHLDATLTKLSRNGRIVYRNRSTPATLVLQPYAYTATFALNGYLSKTVEVAPEDREVIARLEPASGRISVIVLDAETREPLPNVAIRYKSLETEAESDKLLSVTDEDGTCNSTLKAGLYLFFAGGEQYQYQEQSLMIQASDLNLIEFSISKTAN